MAGEGRIQNVQLPYQTFVETASPGASPAGTQRFYVDPADHLLKRINSSGTITVIDPSSITTLASLFSLTGDITPSQITSNQNDYNPTSLSTASVLRLSSDASRDITGLQGGSDGRILVLMNVGAQNIVLKDENASSTAGNRFALTGDITMTPDLSVWLIYDSTSSRWRSVGSGASGGGGGSTGALIFIQEFTASAAASIVVTGIDNTYQEHILTFDIAPATDNVQWSIEFSTDGGSTWLNTGYKYGLNNVYSNGFASNISSDGTTIFQTGELGNASGEHMVAKLHMYNFAGGTQKLARIEQAAVTQQPYMAQVQGFIGNTTLTAINAVRLKFSSGNIATGRATLYGVKNS